MGQKILVRFLLLFLQYETNGPDFTTFLCILRQENNKFGQCLKLGF